MLLMVMVVLVILMVVVCYGGGWTVSEVEVDLIVVILLLFIVLHLSSVVVLVLARIFNRLVLGFDRSLHGWVLVRLGSACWLARGLVVVISARCQSSSLKRDTARRHIQVSKQLVIEVLWFRHDAGVLDKEPNALLWLWFDD
jgi:hypothetical protein